MGRLTGGLPTARGFWQRLSSQLTRDDIDRSALPALAVFRVVSCALTSVSYFLVADDITKGMPARLAVVTLLFSATAAGIWLFRRAVGSRKRIMRLVLLEAALLPALLLPTGGLNSPFVWYALNPLLIAAVHLSSAYFWAVFATFMGAVYVSALLNPSTQHQIIAEDGRLLTTLLLVMLGIQVLVRFQRQIQSQARKIEQQSHDLQEAYDVLDLRQQAVASLADFQGEVIGSESEDDLYRSLVETAVRRFGADWAAVLYAVPVVAADLVLTPWLANVPGCRLASAGHYPELGIDWAPVWARSRDAGYGEFAEAAEGISATPVLVRDGRVLSVFACTGGDPATLVELAILVEYAGQLAGRMSATARIRRTLDRLEDIYQMVEGAGVAQSERDLADMTIAYASAVTGGEESGYWPASADAPDLLSPSAAARRGPEGDPAGVASRAPVWWTHLRSDPTPVREYYLQGSREWYAAYAPVRSSDRLFGLLYAVNGRPFNMEADVPRTMGFLGYLMGAMLERQRVENLHDRLLVAEEQGRIAAEIHDGASQGLFGLIYGLEGAVRTLGEGKTEEALGTLQTMRDVAASVSRELRTSIYQLASNEGDGAFVGALRAHLMEVGELYGVSTALSATGSEENLSPALRRALHRIVREATSNAIRHGKSSQVDVSLSLSPQQVVLEVRDDGCGFTPSSLARPFLRAKDGKVGGLGLLNMSQLARSFDGSLRVDSAPGRGCRLTMKIPDRQTGESEVRASEIALG